MASRSRSTAAVPLGHTGLGRGLLALVRCAAGRDAGADHLLAWLRTPGLLTQPGLADRLEARLRREGAHTAAQARDAWEAEHWKLDDLDRLARSRRPADFLAELERQLGRLFAGPYRRRAAVLRGPELEDPRVYATARAALAELRAVVEADPRTRLEPERVLAVLEELQVRLGEPPQPDRVQVAKPEAIRARRFEAVFVCGLQEGEFPTAASPEPFLPDEDRRAVARASGLRLPVREDRLERERFLFYTCCSRAERLLVLSSRSSDEEGNPQAESFFVEDVRDLLAPGAELRTRSLSEVTWPPEAAPTAAELERALAAAGARAEEPTAGPLGSEPLLERLAAREAVSAGALERFADCPVKWLVEDLLRPLELAPDPEAMVRGDYAHSVLEHTYRRLREETGERRVTRGQPRPRRAHPAGGAAASAARCSGSPPSRPACARPCAGSSSTCCAGCAARPRRTARSSPSTSSSTSEPTRRWRWPRACACEDASTEWTRTTAWRWWSTTRPASGWTATRSRAGSGRTASRPRSTCSSSSGCSACERPGACTLRSASADRARAGCSPPTSPSWAPAS